MTKIRLGTRASQLALWQSNWVRSRLEQLGLQVELVKIETSGDAASAPLSQIGGQGLFTKRLQEALLDHKIDLAVHSLKDLPTDDHSELTIAAIPEREDASDALVLPRKSDLIEPRLAGLRKEAIVGTGSVRRAAQLLSLRSDLRIKDIRGNVDTRLRKLDEGEFDAIVLAVAGLTRLGWSDRITYRFSQSEMLPAVGQGALGLETRAADESTLQAVRPLNHPFSYFSAIAERAMLMRLFAGCLAPVGAHTWLDGKALALKGVVLSGDGREKIECQQTASIDDAKTLGTTVAQQLISMGADQLLKSPKRTTD
jgi:hydroxymethylbilane synthase